MGVEIEPQSRLYKSECIQMMDNMYHFISDSSPLDIPEHCLLDRSEMDLDIVNDLFNPKLKLTDIGHFDLESFFNPPATNNNNNINNNSKVIVKEEPVAFNSFSSIQMKSEPCFISPNSPAESSFSTDEFPLELSDLEPYESEIDSEEFQVLKTFTVPVFKLESPDNEVKDYNIIPSDCDADHLRPQRIRRRPRAFSPDSTDSESDPDYDPEEEEEEHPPRKKTVKKEI